MFGFSDATTMSTDMREIFCRDPGRGSPVGTSRISNKTNPRMSNAQTLKSLLETNAALKAELANLRELSTARQPLPPAMGAAAGGADESTSS